MVALLEFDPAHPSVALGRGCVNGPGGLFVQSEATADRVSGEVAEGVVQGWAQFESGSVAFRFNTGNCRT
ncbi:hypothetical protein [Nocardioides sp.]|uniref:hypothetical protein n=1 Tax=Nocardioides sp. TaxID=35761 RepID=UPI003565C84C